MKLELVLDILIEGGLEIVFGIFSIDLAYYRNSKSKNNFVRNLSNRNV